MLAQDKNDQPVTVTIRRTVRGGRELAIEQALREFIPKSLAQPGHLGVQVLKPTANDRQYIVVFRFATGRDWEQFKRWPEYVEWTSAIREHLESDPEIHEECGLESWFALPGRHLVPVLPRWKMALATLLGVYPTSILLGLTLRQVTGNWHFALQSLAFSIAMVAFLTWLVMPLITRLLRPWLYPT